jgi:hypothetical protein
VQNTPYIPKNITIILYFKSAIRSSLIVALL